MLELTCEENIVCPVTLVPEALSMKGACVAVTKSLLWVPLSDSPELNTLFPLYPYKVLQLVFSSGNVNDSLPSLVVL